MSRVNFIILLIVIAACSKKENETARLFELLDSQKTGIHFSNDLNETSEFNILEYLYFYNGGGVAIGDINNDSLPDIYFTANQKSNKLYLNLGDFKFKDITESANVVGKGNWSTGVTMADVNADGHLDIYVSYVSGYKGTTGHNELYINNGDLTFSEQAALWGLDFRGFGTQATFFDYDNDSDLDVYLLRHSVHSVNSYGNADLRKQIDPRAGDRLLQSQLAQGQNLFKDVTVGSGIYSSQIGYGLGLAISDLNQDGWQDIYVSNDFHENDYLYLNNQNGTFTESLESMLGHSSRYSMGNDIADLNNDGLPDIFTTDMLPQEPSILLKSGGEDKSEVSEIKLKFGYGHQLARNALQVNRGNGHFSDIALMAGVFATDWSWSPLLADFDNDGFKDIFISNGIVKRPNDLDYIQYISNLSDFRYTNSNQDSIDQEMIKRMPTLKIRNELFKSIAGRNWRSVSGEWGLTQPSYSNGVAYADLDNDGDLDLVVNNINEKAFVYHNNSQEQGTNNYIKISFNSDDYNTNAIGSRVRIHTKDKLIQHQLSTTRGFQSSVPPVFTIGLGSEEIDSIEVFWPNGMYQVLKNVKPNQWLHLEASQFPQLEKFTNKPTTFKAATSSIAFKHQENVYNDFNVSYLTPYKLSAQGPAMAVADVNGDRLEDVFLGGAAGQLGELFLQEISGSFKRQLIQDFKLHSEFEDVSAIFFDADNDSDLDLLVLSGGYEYPSGHQLLQDRLYLNKSGNFQLSSTFPQLSENSSCAAVIDYDNDGDVDLFIGFDGITAQYGVNGGGHLLQNDGQGNFTDVTADVMPMANDLGMIKSAIWVDYNNDNYHDLVLAGHWMPISILRNNQGRLDSLITVQATAGMWNVISAEDIDKDGDIDLVGGNMGLNNKFRASIESPLKLYFDDFDDNNSMESVIMHNVNDRYVPLWTKDELEKQLVPVKKRYTTYRDFANKVNDIQDIVDLKESTVIREVDELRSMVFLNENESFKPVPLPHEIQYSSVNTILLSDLNGDGLEDIITSGNNLNTHVNLGRYDSDFGSVTLNSTDGSFRYFNNLKSGLYLNGQISESEEIVVNGKKHFLFATNGDSVQIYKLIEYEQ